jgi:hypothetical protein
VAQKATKYKQDRRRVRGGCGGRFCTKAWPAMITCAIRSVHVPREAKIAGCTRPRPCASSTASQTCSAHVFGPGVANRLRVEPVYRGGRSGGRVSDRLTAVTSHEQDKCFGMNARDV